MTRRWSLVTTIVVLTVALAFVVVQIVQGRASGKAPVAAESPASSPGPSPSAGAGSLRGVGWWPLHQSGAAEAGGHDAVFGGGSQWGEGPGGGALKLDGASGFADTGMRLDTVGGDYSVAARVLLTPRALDGVHTAVSEDADPASAFLLQYSGQDGNFAFGLPGARALAKTSESPRAGHWYHLTGTYGQNGHRMRIYVDGALVGTATAPGSVKPTGTVVIGRDRLDGKAADYWNGRIDDVHVYDRELTPDDVKSLASGEPR